MEFVRKTVSYTSREYGCKLFREFHLQLHRGSPNQVSGFWAVGANGAIAVLPTGASSFRIQFPARWKIRPPRYWSCTAPAVHVLRIAPTRRTTGTGCDDFLEQQVRATFFFLSVFVFAGRRNAIDNDDDSAGRSLATQRRYHYTCPPEWKGFRFLAMYEKRVWKKRYNNSPPTLVPEGVFDVVVEGERRRTTHKSVDRNSGRLIRRAVHAHAHAL